MNYHVKNGSYVAKAFKVRGGHQVVPARTSVDVLDARELTEAQIVELSLVGIEVNVIDPAQAKGSNRDDNGDTKGEALLRKQFDASWNQARAAAGAADGESLNDAISRLVSNAASAESFEEELRSTLGLNKDEGIIEGIAALKDRIAELELQIEELEKEDDTTPELEAKHRGGGSYSVLDADGKELVEKLDKETAEKFNVLSDEEKAAFVSEHKKAD